MGLGKRGDGIRAGPVRLLFTIALTILKSLCATQADAVEGSFVSLRSRTSTGEVKTQHYLELIVRPDDQAHPKLQNFLAREGEKALVEEYISRKLLAEDKAHDMKSHFLIGGKKVAPPKTSSIYYFELKSPALPKSLSELDDRLIGSIKVVFPTPDHPLLPSQERLLQQIAQGKIRAPLMVEKGAPDPATAHLDRSFRSLKSSRLKVLNEVPAAFLEPIPNGAEVKNFLVKRGNYPGISERLINFAGKAVRQPGNFHQTGPVFLETSVGARLKLYQDVYGFEPKLLFEDSILTVPGGPKYTTIMVHEDVQQYFYAMHKAAGGSTELLTTIKTSKEFESKYQGLSNSDLCQRKSGHYYHKPCSLSISLAEPIVSELDGTERPTVAMPTTEPPKRLPVQKPGTALEKDVRLSKRPPAAGCVIERLLQLRSTEIGKIPRL